jgi:hypothetical protein
VAVLVDYQPCPGALTIAMVLIIARLRPGYGEAAGYGLS